MTILPRVSAYNGHLQGDVYQRKVQLRLTVLEMCTYITEIPELHYMVKVKLTLYHAMKTQRGSRGVNLLFLLPRIEVGGQCYAPAALPWERPGNYCTGGWVGGGQGRSGRVPKVSPLPGFNIRSV